MATAAQYLAAAASELGYTEQPPGSNNNKFAAEAGHANKQPWCASFVVAIANRVGLGLPSRSAYTPTLADGFRTAKRFYTTPEPGDFVFYDWPGDGVNRIQHVGVVEAVHSTSITTIEGNTSADNNGSQSNGGGVFRRTRTRNSSIVGYGRPAYDAVTPTPNPETDLTNEEHNMLVDNWHRLQNLEAVAHRDIDVLQPMIQQIIDDLKNDPNHGAGTGDVDPAAVADAVIAKLHEVTA